MKFRDILDEKYDSDNWGFDANAELMDIRVRKEINNDLMYIEVKGKRVLPKLPSVEKLKGDYQEKYWDQLEKIYKTLTEKYGKRVDDLLHKFEKDLNKEIVQMEKELSKF